MRRFFKVLRRVLLILLITIVWLVAVLYISIRIICYGPSTQARDIFVTTMLETGQLKWVVGMLCPMKTSKK